MTDLVRAPVLRLVDDGEALLAIGGDGVVRRLDGASAALARAILDEAAAPRPRDALRDAIAAVAEGATPVIDDAIDLLIAVGALVPARAPAEPSPAGRVVLAVTGAVAAVHTPALALALERRGWTVEIALSHAARRFVAPSALAAITHRAPHVSPWPASPVAPVPHVALAAWADLVLVCPASATTIARLAGGDFSDLVAAIALTTRAPVVLVPSMNPAMREAASVHRNLAQCRDDGLFVVHGATGVEVAEAPGARTPVAGAAPPPDVVAAIVDTLWRSGALRARKPPHAPSTAAGWDDLWAATPTGRLPWASDTVDADLAAALAAHAPPPRSLLDVGTGLGVVARHAAALGYRVVATDVSDTALHLARGQGGEVVWLRDDVCASSLAARFDVVVDRGCLHVLPPARRLAWAAAMHRLVAPGGVLVVKHHRGVLDLGALLGERFTLLARTDSELPGPRGIAPAAATLALFARRDAG